LRCDVPGASLDTATPQCEHWKERENAKTRDLSERRRLPTQAVGSGRTCSPPLDDPGQIAVPADHASRTGVKAISRTSRVSRGLAVVPLPSGNLLVRRRRSGCSPGAPPTPRRAAPLLPSHQHGHPTCGPHPCPKSPTRTPYLRPSPLPQITNADTVPAALARSSSHPPGAAACRTHPRDPWGVPDERDPPWCLGWPSLCWRVGRRHFLGIIDDENADISDNPH
jgi:hypothetical protein